MPNKYRVQQKYANPEAVREHSGKTHRWVDLSTHRTKGEANRARLPHQRVIKVCTKSEPAWAVDSGAYPGRRFDVITEAN